ncbi:hypothetical protein, partial [Streptomyces griseus]|uniref:hypothetical protein n=1 Tax=Streptomyces griseus TaxID=1911 RepID=UPI0033EB2AF9
AAPVRDRERPLRPARADPGAAARDVLGGTAFTEEFERGERGGRESAEDAVREARAVPDPPGASRTGAPIRT